MADHRAPLKELLRDPVSEQDIQGAWRGIQTRRARAEGGTARRTSGWIALGALAAGLTLFLILGNPRPDSVSTEAQALGTESGQPLEVLAAAALEPRAVKLSDGSRITLEPGAEAEVLENTGRSFVTVLRRGEVHFEVQPGGPRRWSVECSLATIEVVGTAFTVTRAEHRVRVEVQRGVVLVRGERVPDRIQRLLAGERLELSEEAAAPEPAPEPARSPEPSVAPAAPPAAPPPGPVTPSTGTWRSAATRGDHRSAYAKLGEDGLRREAGKARDIDTLLMLADVARQSGHPEQAVDLLRRAVEEHPGDPRTGMAAFTLGRLELEVLGQAERAAESFARVIALGEPRGLVEDAHARRVQAYAQAGAWEQARAAAEQYEQLYPEGYRLQDVRRWATGP
jgi:transmembrane sensor